MRSSAASRSFFFSRNRADAAVFLRRLSSAALVGVPVGLSSEDSACAGESASVVDEAAVVLELELEGEVAEETEEREVRARLFVVVVVEGTEAGAGIGEDCCEGVERKLEAWSARSWAIVFAEFGC